MVKRRRVLQKDLEKVETFITEEVARRKKDPFRKKHEAIWKMVDKQIQMDAPEILGTSDPNADWHSAVPLGDIADASEVITADVMRLMFPADRGWFAPHADVRSDRQTMDDNLTDDEGQMRPFPQRQTVADGLMRSLMSQQHLDFGLKSRVKLSVKEALHHGSFVAEVAWGLTSKFPSRRGAIEQMGAPIWIPHSMWNCYPDPSPSVIGTELFYKGSMIIEHKMPLNKVMEMPWKNLERVRQKSGSKKLEDVTITKFWGDIVIDRQDGEVHVPNQKVTLAEGIWVDITEMPLPYPNVLYFGYERDDVRDPYYSSPLIKRAPMHHLATILFNRFIDAVELKTEPPIVYNSLDPRFAQSGGPAIYPRAKIPSKGNANITTLDVGDPTSALNGLIFAKQHVAEGTSTDAIRKGVSPGTDQTATEVLKQDQKSEIRTVEFLGSLANHGLRPFLYMQHDFNLKKLSEYPFFNNEMNTPDFLRLSKSHLPKSAHFDITGFKSILGEETRQARFQAAVAISTQNQLIAERTDWDEVAAQVWKESGEKDPERFVVVRDEREKLQALVQQATQELQQQLQQVGQELQKLQLVDEKRQAEKAQLQVQIREVRAQVQEQDTIKQALAEQLKLEKETQAAKEELEKIRDQIEDQALALKDVSNEEAAAIKGSTAQTQQVVTSLVDRLAQLEEQRQKRNKIILDHLKDREETKEVVSKLTDIGN